MKKSLISVVVPVYGTEKFIRKCLDSIINQTYKNLEIIVVNDCSPDGSAEILEEYKQKDKRIKVINHEKNRGLFRARITGISQATGDYIGIVDSDDYISADYYRRLLETATETKADIVMGKIVHEKSDGYRYVHNSYFNMKNVERSGEEVFDKFMEQEGYCFIWHTVWNKLYSKAVWDKTLPYLKQMEDHIIMCEDVLYSTIIHYFAKSLVSTDYAYYFYMQHAGASTANDNNFNKFKKNIGDLVKVFCFVEKFLKEKNVSQENLNHFQNWKELYSRFWYDNVSYSALNGSSKTILLNTLKNGLNLDEVCGSSKKDNYFYQLTSPFDARYENIINEILNEKTQVVSFDIFDTVLVRPFFRPTDLFLTLDEKFDKLCKNSVLTNFSDIRILAEKECRENVYKSEEVTLDEIYDYISEKFHIEKAIAEKMKDYEILAEQTYCNPRKSVLNLINIAKTANKKVVFVTDFYMDKAFFEKLLKNKKVNYDEIFISSEIGLTKATGTLFGYVIKKLKVPAKNIVHIGDNWQSDHDNAIKNGINAIFYASTKQAFMYEISDIKSSDSTALYKRPSGMWINYEKSLAFFETRCALALCANELYDNPYYSYNENTLFNGDANFIGYYALGMHLWAIAKWLYTESVNKKGKLHFIARDGYLPKLAYDILNKNNDARESSYIYVSRKSLMPLSIKEKNNFYELCNITKLEKQNPKKLLEIFEPVLNKKTFASLLENATSEPFGTKENAFDFVEKVLCANYDEKCMQEYRKNMYDYFSKIIKKGDVTFDIGYSGRTQILLTELLGFNIDSYFIHSNDDLFVRKQNQMGITVKKLYDYSPSITGSVREFSISEMCPSCIGYDFKKGTPKFEDYKISYPWKFAIGQMQERALDFVQNMQNTFGVRSDFCARPMDLSMPYEYLLHKGKWEDTNYLLVCEFEDDLYEGKTSNLSNIWQRDMAYHHVLAWKDTVPNIQYVQLQEGEQGVYAKMYNKLCRMFPAGTKRRKFAMGIAKMFVGKDKKRTKKKKTRGI